jgi:hypothetical protein
MLAILGSGETAPTMIKAHRALFDRLGPDAEGIMLDTPFGFQENADELSEKAVQYFRQSVGRTMAVARLRRTEAANPLEVEAALSRIRQAPLLFAGPGSPTYALRQWAGTPVPSLLADRLAHGGVVTFASAAALTLGVRTVPVYEVYKAGFDPFWLEGLDLLSAFGLPVAVIPHYDNAEGGHHDTRFCYLGESRLARLERELPDGAFVLGVDEHTGVLLDFDADTAEVVGNGRLTLRRAGRSVEVPAGETVPLDLVRRAGESRSAAASPGAKAGAEPTGQRCGSQPDAAAAAAAVGGGAAAAGDVDLASATRRLEAAFGAALGAGDADGATAAMLELEQAMIDWAGDSLQSDGADQARAALRSMIVRLGAAARSGLVDPRTVLEPVVDAAIALRTAVRAEKRYDLSDLLRDRLAGAGIEVRDTPSGPVWDLTAT